jgi:hypothetical protein
VLKPKNTVFEDKKKTCPCGKPINNRAIFLISRLLFSDLLMTKGKNATASNGIL